MPGYHVAEFDFGYDLGIEVPGQKVHILPGSSIGLYVESDQELVLGALTVGEGIFVLCTKEAAETRCISNKQTIPAMAAPGSGTTVYVAGEGVSISFRDMQLIEAHPQKLSDVGVRLESVGF